MTVAGTDTLPLLWSATRPTGNFQNWKNAQCSSSFDQSVTTAGSEPRTARETSAPINTTRILPLVNEEQKRSGCNQLASSIWGLDKRTNNPLSFTAGRNKPNSSGVTILLQRTVHTQKQPTKFTRRDTDRKVTKQLIDETKAIHSVKGPWDWNCLFEPRLSHFCMDAQTQAYQ
jgi:hypothetical protein